MESSILKSMNVIQPIIERKLASQPDDINLLKRLEEIYRQKGELIAAKKIARKLLSLDENSDYIKVLNNLISSFSPNDWQQNIFWPTPYIHQENVLCEQEHQDLLQYCYSKKAHFDVASVGKKDGVIKKDLNFRNQTSYDLDNQGIELVYNKLKQHVISGLSELGLQRDKIKIHAIQISQTPKGGYGKVHSDGVPGTNETPLREFSFLYYPASQPKAFTGGDLLLYDTNFKKNKFSSNLTKISLSPNSLVLFPRYFHHEITQVQSPSALAWEDGRFAILIRLKVEDGW